MAIDIGDHARLYSREEWGADENLGSMGTHTVLREVFIHHTTNSNAEQLDTLAEQKAAMRATQDFHRYVRGWSDIGYAFVVFQPYGNLDVVRIMRGRLTKWIPAAQEGHNTGTVPICVYGNFQGDDGVKAITVDAIADLCKHVDSANNGSLVSLGGHRDVQGTTCPGDSLYAKVPEIARRAGLRRY